MRVVLDTNVIVSAFASRGLCSDILELCLAEHKIVLSLFILQETRRALTRKIKLPSSLASNIQEFLSAKSEIVAPASVTPRACRDKSDLKVLGTAEAGKAAALITGDKDLLDLKKFKTIAILSPRQFWNLIQGQSEI